MILRGFSHTSRLTNVIFQLKGVNFRTHDIAFCCPTSIANTFLYYSTFLLELQNVFKTIPVLFNLSCHQNEPFTFLRKVIIQILSRNEQINFDIVPIGDAEEAFAVLISVIEIITDNTETIKNHSSEHSEQITLKSSFFHEAFYECIG